MRKALSLMALGAVVASTSVQANENWYVAADVFGVFQGSCHHLLTY